MERGGAERESLLVYDTTMQTDYIRLESKNLLKMRHKDNMNTRLKLWCPRSREYASTNAHSSKGTLVQYGRKEWASIRVTSHPRQTRTAEGT